MTTPNASPITTLIEVPAPPIPAGADVMTVLVEVPPGSPGTPPHRHTGPVFGYVTEGEVRWELEGEPERVLRAGDPFWEPGGDVIHYQAGNARSDGWARFVAVMLCVPDQPMLTLVEPAELAARRDRRAPRPE